MTLAETASKALYFAVISDVACVANGAMACSAPPMLSQSPCARDPHLNTRIRMPRRRRRLGVDAERKRGMGASFKLPADQP